MSVWVEIFKVAFYLLLAYRHAPRERVSWNWFCRNFKNQRYVTLHVSVWVEILTVLCLRPAYPSRSTWACELKWQNYRRSAIVSKSRSTWACELKSLVQYIKDLLWCHAPRERVSWNCKIVIYSDLRKCHVPRERVGQFSFQRRTYWYWIIQVTAWLRSGGIFIPKYYTIFMRFPSNSPIHTPKFVQTNDL